MSSWENVGDHRYLHEISLWEAAQLHLRLPEQAVTCSKLRSAELYEMMRARGQI